jgi:hypothetical protein
MIRFSYSGGTMKKWLAVACLAIATASCAHLGLGSDTRERTDLWNEAHTALYREEFAQAEALFQRLAAEHANTTEGREALLYVGGIHLDPRNRDWNPERAETVLHQYLLQDTVGGLIHRRPEATTLLEIARQLNLPPEERVDGLRPRTVVVETPAPRVITPATQLRELQEDNARLRQQLAQRDDQLRRQREELERIRRALAPRPTPQ